MSLHFAEVLIISPTVVRQISYSAYKSFRWMLTHPEHRIPKVVRTPPKSDNYRFCAIVTWRCFYNRGVIVCVLGDSVCCADGYQLVLRFTTKLSNFCCGNQGTRQLVLRFTTKLSSFWPGNHETQQLVSSFTSTFWLNPRDYCVCSPQFNLLCFRPSVLAAEIHWRLPNVCFCMITPLVERWEIVWKSWY